MEKKDLRIVFMGTPEFAEFCLRKLIEEQYNVVGVVTMPDKPVGRHGSVLQASPVKQCAIEFGIPVLQPERLRDETFLDELKSLNAQLQIVVAFRMLPQVVWNMPPMGTFNLHASLLPQYRGAAPINWAIINGDRETGVTTFFLKHDIDTGDIIHQERTPIYDSDNAGTLHDRLMEIGAELVCRTVRDIIDGSANTVSQHSEGVELRPAPKIFKDTCRIDWNLSARRVFDFIRGMSPYPGAWTVMTYGEGKCQDFKIMETELSADCHGEPGTVRTDGRKYIEVACGDGMGIKLLQVQAWGRKRMPVRDFLCGGQFDASCRFE